MKTNLFKYLSYFVFAYFLFWNGCAQANSEECLQEQAQTSSITSLDNEPMGSELTVPPTAYQCISDPGQLRLLNTLGVSAERGICTYTIRNGNPTDLIQRILDIFRNDFLSLSTIPPRLVNHSTLVTWWHPNSCLRNQVGRLLYRLDLPRNFPLQDKVQIEVLLARMNEERFNEIGVMISQLTRQRNQPTTSSPGSGNAFNTFLPWGAADIFRVIGISSKSSSAKTIGYYSCLVGNGQRCSLTNIDNVYRDTPVGQPIKEFVGFIFGATVQTHQTEMDLVRLEDVDLRLAFPSNYQGAMTQYFEMPSGALDLALGNSNASDSLQIIMGHTKIFDQKGREIGVGGNQDKDFAAAMKRGEVHSKVMVMVRTTKLTTDEALDAIRTSQRGGYLPTRFGEFSPHEFFNLPNGYWKFEKILESLHFVPSRSANIMSNLNQYQVIAFNKDLADQREVLRHLIVKFKGGFLSKPFEVERLNLSTQNLMISPYIALPSFTQDIELNQPVDFYLQVLVDDEYRENQGRKAPKVLGMTYKCRYYPVMNRTDILSRHKIFAYNYWYEKW